MADKSATPRRWKTGALRAARAAAFLTLATGINGTVSAYFPRYEPFYVYLISVIVVAWLSGVLLGVTAAIGAVVLYDWMFSPMAATGPSAASAVPLAVAVTAAIVTQLARAPLKRQSLPTPSPPPALLTATIVRDDVTDGRIAELQGQLAQAHTSSRLRAQALQEAADREGALNHEVEAARASVAEQNARSSSLRRDVETAKQRNLELDARVASLQQELEVAYRKIDEERARKTDAGPFEAETKDLVAKLNLSAEQLGKLRRELDDARRIANDERARGDREASLRAQMENAARQTLQRTADVASSHQRSEGEARKGLQAAEARAELLQQELDRVRAILEDETNRADRESELREHLELTGDKLLQVAADLTTRTQERDAARAEIAALRQRLNAELEGRKAKEADFDARLQKVVAGLTEDYEQFIGVSLVEKETARAENRSLTKRVETLQRKLAEASDAIEQPLAEVSRNVAERERLSGELQAVRQELAAEKQMRAQTDGDFDTARAENASLAARIEQLETELAAKTSALPQMEAEFDAKLQKVVAGLTEDYEQFIGVSVVEKESAKAENRSLTARVQELQKKLDAETSARDRAEAIFEGAEAKFEAQKQNLGERVRDLEQQIEAEKKARAQMDAEFDARLQKVVNGLTEDYEQFIGVSLIEKETARAENRRLNAKLDELKAAREKLELEWSEKLQKIVTNLASDHETDLGNAMVEKEAAKAEARSLQKRLQEEREHFRRLTERWQNERESLMKHVPAPQADPFPAAGTQRAPVVLVVHSDASVRAMCKHELDQSGYTVLTAADGLEGLRIAASHKPDAVLAEAVMPKMNGRELVQLLKSRRETAGMKIILMSGANSADIERGSDFRADDFLRDATDFNVMRATLATVLHKRR